MQGIQSKYGVPRDIVLELPSIEFPPVSEREHGEVCMAIRRKSGGFLLQTKESYPNSVMRLPSGGIKAGEDIEHALMREIWEETNLEVSVDRYIATLGYTAGSAKSRFKTHLFLVHEVGGEFGNNDPSEKISDWCEAEPSELTGYARKLCEIDPSWSNWGLFRAASLDTLADYCEKAAL